jgi:nucleoside-diphosphate-sugar epimerase
MKIIVTGGNGILGQSLIHYLLEHNHSIISIDQTAPAVRLPSVEYIIADMCDFHQFIKNLQGGDALVHLAALTNTNPPDHVVYSNNTISSYNALYVASTLGIKRVCLASSINAIGGYFSRSPRYDYFPLNENHPPYTEDPYSLSKWVLEQQGNDFAHRFSWITIASLRLHMLVDTRAHAIEKTHASGSAAARHLWGYTLLSEASHACLLSLTADFVGHEVFYITAPSIAALKTSQELAREYYPDTLIKSDFLGHTSFFDTAKATRLLGWSHKEN